MFKLFISTDSADRLIGFIYAKQLLYSRLGRSPILPPSSMATLTAQFCSPEEQVISAKANAPIHCLTRNESIALAVRPPWNFFSTLS